ncbi:unnamed protein product [Caenorhabditis brenneri]
MENFEPEYLESMDGCEEYIKEFFSGRELFSRKAARDEQQKNQDEKYERELSTHKITETSELTIYEKTFAKSDKTDAILVVDGKKLHVNKALLCYHSDYFKSLFNSEFKEEIEIKDVDFDDFATLLSLIQDDPLEIKEYQIENLLKLADQFLIPAAKRHVELFICSIQMDKFQKLKLVDEYNLEMLLNRTILSFNTKDDFYGVWDKAIGCSDRIKFSLSERYFELFQYSL